MIILIRKILICLILILILLICIILIRIILIWSAKFIYWMSPLFQYIPCCTDSKGEVVCSAGGRWQSTWRIHWLLAICPVRALTNSWQVLCGGTPGLSSVYTSNLQNNLEFYLGQILSLCEAKSLGKYLAQIFSFIKGQYLAKSKNPNR